MDLGRAQRLHRRRYLTNCIAKCQPTAQIAHLCKPGPPKRNFVPLAPELAGLLPSKLRFLAWVSSLLRDITASSGSEKNKVSKNLSPLSSLSGPVLLDWLDVAGVRTQAPHEKMFRKQPYQLYHPYPAPGNQRGGTCLNVLVSIGANPVPAKLRMSEIQRVSVNRGFDHQARVGQQRLQVEHRQQIGCQPMLPGRAGLPFQRFRQVRANFRQWHLAHLGHAVDP
jgi:hypothetical protein